MNLKGWQWTHVVMAVYWVIVAVTLFAIVLDSGGVK